jgi:hypothetical protein
MGFKLIPRLSGTALFLSVRKIVDGGRTALARDFSQLTPFPAASCNLLSLTFLSLILRGLSLNRARSSPMRFSWNAISAGCNSLSTHPVSTALCGMSGCLAVPFRYVLQIKDGLRMDQVAQLPNWLAGALR